MNLLEERKETKEFRRLVLLFFWKMEKRMKKNSTSFWSKNFSWKRKDWTKTFWKMKRNESERSIKNLLKDCKIVWKKMFWNSCYGHIFIISWWLKLKFVTPCNFFKTSHLLKIVTLLKTTHLKSCDFWKNHQKQVTWRIVTFGNLFFEISHW